MRRRVLTLHPGDIALGERGDTFETLLGSCVAIVLTDPRRHVGAACHVVRGPADGEAALGAIRAALLARGMSMAGCEAWLHGGGNMFPQLIRGPHVGDANVCWALEALARDGLRVLGCDTGGHGHRRLRWTVGPGAPRVEAVPLLHAL